MTGVRDFESNAGLKMLKVKLIFFQISIKSSLLCFFSALCNFSEEIVSQTVPLSEYLFFSNEKTIWVPLGFLAVRVMFTEKFLQKSDFCFQQRSVFRVHQVLLWVLAL